jgi:hypothetical protein
LLDDAINNGAGQGKGCGRQISESSAPGNNKGNGRQSSGVGVGMRGTGTVPGRYKGELVAIKPVHRKCVDLTRKVRKELQLVRPHSQTLF